jgi:hypothetical protein
MLPVEDPPLKRLRSVIRAYRHYRLPDYRARDVRSADKVQAHTRQAVTGSHHILMDGVPDHPYSGMGGDDLRVQVQHSARKCTQHILTKWPEVARE